MIELLTANTPNGKKISIMLEEIKFSYKITKKKLILIRTSSLNQISKKLAPLVKYQ